MDLEIGNFEGYELVDSGEGRKLERFGDTLMDRPCPQAIWPRRKRAGWKDAAATFQRGEGGNGEWTSRKNLPDSWPARIDDLEFEIRLTGFGNVGLFPEHTCHWAWIADLLKGKIAAGVLNLFAYTGGATMACAAAGASVVHVDAARSVNNWAMINAKRSGIREGSIRYLGDDALKLARREGRRNHSYEGLILDPPTFGRGTKGEVWKIERDFFPLCEACRKIASERPLFALLTSHSPGVTPAVLRTMLAPWGGSVVSGEMLLTGGGPALPSGVYARWTPAP